MVPERSPIRTNSLAAEASLIPRSWFVWSCRLQGDAARSHCHPISCQSVGFPLLLGTFFPVPHAALCPGLPCAATAMGFLPSGFSFGPGMRSPAGDGGRGERLCMASSALTVITAWLLPWARALSPHASVESVSVTMAVHCPRSFGGTVEPRALLQPPGFPSPCSHL